MKTNKPKYKWPTLQDRLNRRPTSRVEALRQLQTGMPLSEAARSELEAAQNSQRPSDTGLAEVTLPLAEITRVYGRSGSSANLDKECLELQTRLRAQLSVHCLVTGSWLTRRKAKSPSAIADRHLAKRSCTV